METLPVIQLEEHNGQIFATSLEVAKIFEKQHKDVLRAIQRLETSRDFRERNFAPSTYFVPSGRSNFMKEYEMYYLTRDGFTMVAMGFTGAKATQFKEAYIEAFNKMEAELAKRKRETFQLPDFTNPVEAARAWALEYEAKEKAQAELAIAKPKADVYDAVVAEREMTIHQFCRRFDGVDLNEVKRSLERAGVLFKTGTDYHVYSRYRGSHFSERFGAEKKGHLILIVQPLGQQLLADLYERGKFTMKKRYSQNANSESLSLI